MDLTIEKVEMEQSQDLIKLARQTFLDTFGPPVNTEKDIITYLATHFNKKQIEEELTNPDSFFYFAKIDKEIVGYLKLNKDRAQTEIVDLEALEIERIYVSSVYQGRKIGLKLIEHAMDIAMQLQSRFIWLGVWEKNEKAIGFYQKFGFQTFGKHKFQLGSDTQTDLLMKLVL